MNKMKYGVGDQVILLDTEFNPAVTAKIKEVNTEDQKYLITYSFPEGNKPEEMWVQQERLMTAVDTIRW